MALQQQQETEETALAVYQPPSGPAITGIVRPLVSPQAAQQAVQDYELLKRAIVRPEDQVLIDGKPYLKKSFWRRVSTFFGVSLELVGEEYILDEATGVYGYSVMYRAMAPNGQSCVADGMCMSDDKRDKHGAILRRTRHVIRATAHTRAKNRAISDLVGGGEVSAEEMLDDDPNTVDAAPTATRQASVQRPMRPARSASTQPAYDPLRDAELRRRLTALGYRTVTQVEEFLAMCAGQRVASTHETLLARVAAIEEANRRRAPSAADDDEDLDEAATEDDEPADDEADERDLSTMFGARGS